MNKGIEVLLFRGRKETDRKANYIDVGQMRSTHPPTHGGADEAAADVVLFVLLLTCRLHERWTGLETISVGSLHYLWVPPHGI